MRLHDIQSCRKDTLLGNERSARLPSRRSNTVNRRSARRRTANRSGIARGPCILPPARARALPAAECVSVLGLNERDEWDAHASRVCRRLHFTI